MTPITPFLAVGMAFVLRDISVARFDRRITGPAVVLVVAAFVGVFAFFWPVLTADPISREAWSARIWLDGWV
jgi:dolichyl-phosphate-mannose-protein mannosyltransferase